MLHGFVVLLLLCLLLCTFVDATMVQATCVPRNPTLKLAECTDNCLNTHTGICGREGCMCGDDLKAWCESGNEGPQMWFSQFGHCVSIACADDGVLESLMAIFTLACEGTVGGPLTNDTVPLPLRDYAMKNTFKATATPVVSRPESQSVATLTGVASTGTASLSSNAIATASDNVATVLGDGGSSMSRAANTATSSTSTSEPSEPDKPILSTAAVAGIAVGGTALIALIICVAFFLLRRHKRKKSAQSVSPPAYEPAGEKHAYVKPELDGQALEQQYSETGVGSPVEYAELDTGSPVNSAGERAQLSAHGGRASAAQDS